MKEAAPQKTVSVADKAFEFEAGLYGFPNNKQFLISEIPGGGDIFKQMTAVDQPDLGFTLVFPVAFFPDYVPDIPDEDVRDIGAENPEQVIIMAIASVPEQFKDATANLKAPLVFNPYTRKARQVILSDERYATRQRLFKAQ